MSGVFKSIGKVFKKVVKVVKKVLPYALAAAAVVFTGGAALGVLPAFAPAVGGLGSSLGVGSTLGGVLTGAITKAGFGAAIGGILGGKAGMKAGLVTGAITGGLGGLLGAAGGAAAPAAGGAPTGVIKGASDMLGGAATQAAESSLTPVVDVTSNLSPVTSTIAQTPMGGGNGLGGLLGNPLVASQLLQGLGTGLAAQAQAKEERKAIQHMEDNYTPIQTGLLNPSGSNGQETAGGQWVYDERARRLVKQAPVAVGMG